MLRILIMLIISGCFSAEVMACASFSADSTNVRSGGTVKHFFADKDEVKRLIIKNETDAPCKIKLEAHDILQKLDGGYRYLPFEPNRPLTRSLSPFISIVDSDGKELLWATVSIPAKESLITRINIQSQSIAFPGTHYTAVRANFPENRSGLALTEIFYSNDYQSPMLSLDGLNYDPATQEISYTLKGKGNSYTFINFEVRLIDPETGIEVSGLSNAEGIFKPFTAYIRNFWLPGANDERMIRSKFSVASFNDVFKREVQKLYPDTDFKTKKWVAYIKLRHGIDIDGWKNHRYLALPPKTLELKNE